MRSHTLNLLLACLSGRLHVCLFSVACCPLFSCLYVPCIVAELIVLILDFLLLLLFPLAVLLSMDCFHSLLGVSLVKYFLGFLAEH